MESGRLCLECLVHLKALQTHWAYFSLSDQKLCAEECRREAGCLAQALRELAEEQPAWLEPEFFCPESTADPAETVEALGRWAESGSSDPVDPYFETPSKLHDFLGVLEKRLRARLELPPSKSSSPGGREILYRASFIRWQTHFPTLVLMKSSKTEKMFKRAARSRTIVVMGDIRRSQELMTYAADETSFGEYMVELQETVRRILDDRLGVFDKLTGDGFLAYFNEEICAALGEDYRQCFIRFLEETMDFSSGHFKKWNRTLRKLPAMQPGLCIGADLGRIVVHDLSSYSYFTAVGDTIVWARRMADFGEADEIVLNNLAYEALRDLPGLAFEPRKGATKAGEPFTAWLMRFAREECAPRGSDC